MKQIYWLDRILPSQSPLVGNKAFALSELSERGYPIVNGFVIEAVNVTKLLDIIGNSRSQLTDFLANLDENDDRKLQSVAARCRQEIIGSTIAEEFISPIMAAVKQLNCDTLILRASIDLPEKQQKSYTGLLPGIICGSDPESLSNALKIAWSQLFSARSLFFWQRVGIEIESLNLAILVQSLAVARSSGTIEIDRDSIHMRSSWGLGHSLVRGEVLADYYCVDRVTKKVTRKELGLKMRAYSSKKGNLQPYLLTQAKQEQYSLEGANLDRAIATADRLASEENYLGCLEWTVIDTKTPKFYITQSLPNRSQNTILTVAVKEPFMNQDRLLLKAISASPGIAIANVAIVASENSDVIPPISAKTILVTKNIPPTWFPLLKQAAGLVAEEGGVTSHAAIIARELGIPAVVGATDARKMLDRGQLILLNGTKGEISSLSEGQDPEKLANINSNIPAQIDAAIFNYPIATKLYLNLSQTSSLARNVTNLPVDGIGLLRSELMLLDLLATESLDAWLKPEKKVILSEYITESIAQFASAFAKRPVFYRSFDWHSFTSMYSLAKLNDSDQIKPILFELELEAIAKVQRAGYNNLNLILPFVRSVEEFILCRDRVEKNGLNREESFQLWIMAEVPSIIFLLEKYVEAGVKGISIGTNDLTELLLGTNRDRTEVKTLFNSRHPAMIKAIKQLIKSAKKLGISCSICGQAPVEYPESIEQLIEWGIDSISVEPQAVATTYKAIARAEQSLILKAARSRLSSE